MSEEYIPSEDELVADLQQRQSEQAATHRRTLAEELSIKTKLPNPCNRPVASEAQIQAREEFFRKREESNRQEKLGKEWLRLVDMRGARYENCLLKNYELHGSAEDQECQSRVRAQLVEFCYRMPEAIQLGEGLLFYGPKGTGKDHFAMALARQAILGCGRTLTWVNGMDLWGEIRDGMDSGASERSLIGKYTWPDVLYLSDPLPPTGKLSEHQQAMLFRILDDRYSNRKSVWVTVNVKDVDELEARLGSQNADRLRDGATALHCYWDSYRKTK